MNFLQLLSAMLGLLPNILTAVKAIEAALPDAKGSDKLAAVTTAVTAAAQHAGEVVGQVNAVVAPIQTLVSEVVGVLNSAGVFKHKGDA